MKIRWGRVALITTGVLAAIGVAGLLAPQLDAERMRAPLSVALEETLGRKVQFREVHYQIFPKPGLSAIDLVIPDEPAFGLEPLAYVGEMQAGLSFSSLFTGRLSISSVRLVGASVNLTRRDEQGWNLARLLQRMAAGVAKSGAAPRVVVSEGRVNFKNGTLKSPFYLNAVDLELQPPINAGGALEWRYDASPARTDRSEQGFGRFSGGGKWRPGAGGDGDMAIDMIVERSAISEVLTLVTGRDLGLQGRVSAKATLDGPLNHLRIRGTVELEKVDRPGWFGLRGQQWALGYEGAVDLSGQTVEIHTVKPKDKQALPLTVKLSCTRLLAEPQWDAYFAFEELPAPALLDLARRLGAQTPASLAVEGKVVGFIDYSQSKPLEGNVELRDGKVSMGQAGPLSIETAQIVLDGTSVTLSPVTVETASESRALISGLWRMDSETLDFGVETASLPLAELRSAVASLEGVPALPVLESCEGGNLKGNLRFERGQTGAAQESTWSGRLLATQMVCAVDGAPDPLRIESAAMNWQGTSWSVRKATGVWGPWKFNGEAAYSPDAKRPWHFAITLEDASGATVEQFLQPALMARRSLLDRTLRRQAAVPAWLRGRHAEGTLRIGKLLLDGEMLTNWTARIYWDGANIEMPEVSARWDDAPVSGRASLRLGGISPDLKFLGRVDNYVWKGGMVDAEIELQTARLAGPFPASLRASGHVSGRNVELGEEPVRQFQACFDYDGALPSGRLKLGCLEAQVAGEWLHGPPPSAADGKLEFDLAGPRRTLRFDLLSGETPRTR